MVTCQSANQLKTPAKVSRAFKMVSQFGSLGYTIMGKTVDLTVVQKTIIDTLQKEGKLAVHRVLYPSMLTESWVEGKSVEEKKCTTNRENRSLMWIVKQNRFKNLGELHKEWTEAGVKASRATTHRHVKEFGYSCHQRHLTWAKEKKNWTFAQWSKVLFSDESKFCISFGNQGPRVWRKGGEAHCVFWKPTPLHPLTKKFWSTSCFLLLTIFLKMLISFSSRIWHLHTLPKAPKVGVLDWPANSPDLLYGVLSRGKWETRDQTMQMSWRPLSKKPGLPYHLSSATNWSPPCHTKLRQ